MVQFTSNEGMSNDIPIYKCESEIAGLSLVPCIYHLWKIDDSWLSWVLIKLGNIPGRYYLICPIRKCATGPGQGTVLLLMVRSLGWPLPPPPPQGNNTVRSFSSYFAVTFASSHPILQWKMGFMPGLTRLTIKMNFSKKDVWQNLPRHGRKKNSRSRRHRKIRYETETT